ncbi:hypothetical protein D3C72_2322070 [compost metagenome]
MEFSKGAFIKIDTCLPNKFEGTTTLLPETSEIFLATIPKLSFDSSNLKLLLAAS